MNPTANKEQPPADPTAVRPPRVAAPRTTSPALPRTSPAALPRPAVRPATGGPGTPAGPGAEEIAGARRRGRVEPPRAVEPLREPVAVALRATDPITAEGTATFLRLQNEVRLVPAEALDRAEVLLVMTQEFTDEVMGWIRRAGGPGRDHLRVVLVADAVRESELVRAVQYGVTAVLLRGHSSLPQILQALVSSARGRVHLPETAVAAIIQQLRATQRHAAATSLAARRLQPREIEVLRLLADGLDAAEIGQRLNYSERTIKNIIHMLISRLGLKNRVQAVAWAAREGLL